MVLSSADVQDVTVATTITTVDQAHVLTVVETGLDAPEGYCPPREQHRQRYYRREEAHGSGSHRFPLCLIAYSESDTIYRGFVPYDHLAVQAE